MRVLALGVLVAGVVAAVAIAAPAHYNIAGELVQGGQLLELHVPPGKFR